MKKLFLISLCLFALTGCGIEDDRIKICLKSGEQYAVCHCLIYGWANEFTKCSQLRK